MRASIFIAFFIFVGFGEALLTPEEIEARLLSLELAKSEFEVKTQTLELSNTKLRQAFEVAKSEFDLKIATMELSNTKLNQEVNHLKTQVAELLESKCESELDEANETLVHGIIEDVQDQAECEYQLC